ncbi:MAG: glycosyltransferase family 39 protein [Anaerolineae bacterium]|nr:glycosyltransferase family 39 protein [Anaerolineae bacterium]
MTIVLICTMVLGVFVVIVNMVMVVIFPYSIDYGEGPLLDQAVRIHEGEPVYRASISESPYTITNYPPVFIGILSLFNSQESSSLLPGRILSILATIGSAWMIYQVVFLGYSDRLASWTAVVLFLVFPYVFQWGSFMRVDNLALFFAITSLYVMLRWQQKRWVILPVAVLLTLAAFTRQSYLLAAPFACGVYLLLKDWKRAFFLAGITLLLVGSLFTIFMITTDGGFWQHIGVANQNEFRWETVEWYFRDQLGGPFVIITLVSIFFWLMGWKHIDKWKLAAPFLTGAAVSALTVGKIGSSVNYLLELVSAMAISFGVLFAWLRQPEKETAKWLNHRIVHGLAVALLSMMAVAQLRTMLEIDLLEKLDSIKSRWAAWEELEQIEELIQEVPGQVLLTEQMNLLPQLGKRIYIQPFEYTQLHRDGTWDQVPFVAEIEKQHFDLILMHQWDGERWTDAMRNAIWHHYSAAGYLAQTVVYVPVSEGQTGSDVLECQPPSGWITPTSGAMGAFWYTRQAFIASGLPWGKTPVYAVADGILYHFPGWNGAVAIQHDDPLHPDQKIWTFYGSMRHPWNEEEEYIVDRFPMSFTGFPVEQGELIGYQGAVELPGTDLTSRLHFAVVPADESGFFPVAWWELPINPDAYQPDLEIDDPLAIRDTRTYLGIEGNTSSGSYVYWYPYRCVESLEGN